MGIGWTEMLVIAVVALLVFGPKELPEAARSLGRFLRQTRKLWSEAQRTFDEALRDAERDIDLEDRPRAAEPDRDVASTKPPAPTGQPGPLSAEHASSKRSAGQPLTPTGAVGPPKG